MDTAWKNRLQEYCQKQKISLPKYRIKNQSGPAHTLKFQVEVEVDHHWYVGDELCSSKKEAEQSAAKKAWETRLGESECSVLNLIPSQVTNVVSITEYADLPPSYSEVVSSDTLNRLPAEYAAIEQFIDTKVKEYGGRIRKISPSDLHGYYKFEINGSYRYCENIRRHHKKNQVYFIVHPIKKTYYQKCYDPECYGFRSALKNIVNEQRTLTNSSEDSSTDCCSSCQASFKYQYRKECERCGEIFCKKCIYECELCHDANHCERCIDLCFDCHDS